MKKDVLGIIALAGIAFVIAVVANAVAGRERKLVLPGFYPDPYRIPAGQQKPKDVAASATTVVPVAGTSAVVPAPPVPAVPTVTDTASAIPATASAPVAAVTAAPSAAPANAAAPTPTPAQPPATAKPAMPEPTVAQRFPAHPDKPFIEIDYNDAAWLHSRGALFLDARRTSVYKEGFIAGARPFSVWESDIDDKVNQLFNERPNPEDQNLPIVIYCSGGACEDSHMLAQKLWGIEFNNVYVYKDGYPDWVKRGGVTRTAQ